MTPTAPTAPAIPAAEPVVAAGSPGRPKHIRTRSGAAASVPS